MIKAYISKRDEPMFVDTEIRNGNSVLGGMIDPRLPALIYSTPSHQGHGYSPVVVCIFILQAESDSNCLSLSLAPRDSLSVLHPEGSASLKMHYKRK